MTASRIVVINDKVSSLTFSVTDWRRFSATRVACVGVSLIAYLI